MMSWYRSFWKKTNKAKLIVSSSEKRASFRFLYRELFSQLLDTIFARGKAKSLEVTVLCFFKVRQEVTVLYFLKIIRSNGD